jgi:hypothetical protein
MLKSTLKELEEAVETLHSRFEAYISSDNEELDPLADAIDEVSAIVSREAVLKEATGRNLREPTVQAMFDDATKVIEDAATSDYECDFRGHASQMAGHVLVLASRVSTRK